VQTPLVEVELADRSRFVLQRIDPEPGYGMVTIHVRAEDEEEPEALIVPLGSIRRFELRTKAEERVGFGFTVPT
jgi:hypothetical protein